MKNKVVIKGEVAEIHINSKRHGHFVTLVDTEDLLRIDAAFTTIHIEVCKSKNSTLYYARGNNRGQRQFLHRFVTNCPDEYVIDHLNSNGLINLKENLRVCTQGENMINSPDRGKYPRGVTFNKGNSKFCVKMTVSKGNQKHLGYFKTLEEAVAVAKIAFSERGLSYIE